MPAATPSPSLLSLAKRQSVVTEVITASSTPTASAAPKKGFPVAVAVPALIGGMAAAVAAFFLFWWLAKRRRREKRRRWERHQQRMAKKRGAASARPSVSSQRANSASSSAPLKSPIKEKEFVPPVPTLPKHAHQPNQYAYGKPEQGYGYRPEDQYQHQNQNQYAHQPTQADHYRGGESNAQPIYAEPSRAEEPEQNVNASSDRASDPPRPSSKSSSRSAARVAAAELAAEASHGDINTRYQPKKPSPLAVKAAERAAGDVGGPKWGEGPFRSESAGQQYSQQQYSQQPQRQSQYLASDPQRLSTGRQISGEWGVALGSPTGDDSFAQQQGQRVSYSNDPYLNQQAQTQGQYDYQRGKSGVYSHDPYAAYHGDGVEEIDHYAPAEGKKTNNWV